MKKTDAATKKALAAEIAANEAKAAKPAKTKGPSAAKMAELEAKIVDAKTGETFSNAENMADGANPNPIITKADGRNRPETWVLSSTPKPTKKVWVIAEEMPGASRKEVIAECIKRGIAPGTSRTQYQAWFKATRDSKPA